MAKTKKSSGNKKTKQGRPSWMSDAVFEISQDFPKLIEQFSGGNEPIPYLDGNLAGILIWQKVYSSSKTAMAAREEAVKLGVVEIAVKLLSSDDAELVKTPAVGILGSLLEQQNARDLFLGVKSQPITTLLNCLENGNPCLRGYTCRAVAKLASAVDSKLNVIKALQDWNWSPLVNIVVHQKFTSMLGGNFAASDASIIIQSVCAESPIPENAVPDSYKELCMNCNKSVIEADVIESMTKICQGKYPNWCKVSIVEALQVLLKGPESSSARRRFVSHGGPEAMVEFLKNPFLALKSKAKIAECLCLAMLNNSKEVTKTSEEHFTNTTKSTLAPENPLASSFRSKSAVLVDFASLKRQGVVSLLLDMCLGPEGPLPDTLPSKTESQTKGRSSSAKKRKGKGAKKKKPLKLEPGMAEAQMFATGCLRILSSDELLQEEIFSAKGIQFLTPLLTSKVQQTRWNTREILLNLATKMEHAVVMERFGVPNYITQSNIPRILNTN